MTTRKSATTHDYLAVINMPYGAGSWARFPDRDKAIKSVLRIAKADWKTLFKMPKGQEMNVVVVDVKGHPDVYWDDRGFFDSKTKEPLAKSRIKVVKGLLP